MGCRSSQPISGCHYRTDSDGTFGLLACLQDPYANYVVQSALTVTGGQLHEALVEAIKPFLPSLRGTPHGKRILAKINLKL